MTAPRPEEWRWRDSSVPPDSGKLAAGNLSFTPRSAYLTPLGVGFATGRVTSPAAEPLGSLEVVKQSPSEIGRSEPPRRSNAMGLLDGKKGLILNVANDRSI